MRIIMKYSNADRGEMLNMANSTSTKPGKKKKKKGSNPTAINIL